MRKISLLNTCFAVVIILAASSCKHEVMFPNNPGGGSTNPPVSGGSQPCNADTVYFVNNVLPLINQSCAMSGCHNAASHQDGVILTDYANIIKEVSPGNPGSSDLYKAIIASGSDRMPPAPMTPFTTDQKNMIYKWILQGAKNNACNSGCDTTIFTYSAAVAPMMNTYCKGCHNPSSPGGGIDLSTYTGVRAAALNGKLYGSITWASGYSPMPKNSAKLSDCQIKQVKKWIDAGTPNN